MLCGDWAIVKSNGTSCTVASLPCRCWSCPHCCIKRRQQLMAQAHGGQPTLMLTLTVNPKRFASPDERARELSHAWRKLRRRAKSKFDLKDLPFLAVFEKTKRGEPHLHILLRTTYLPQKWLSAQMRGYIGAPIVHICKINSSAKVANYICKYIGKNPQRFVGTKRYWCSQDWELPSQDEDEAEDREDWFAEVARCKPAVQVERMIRVGFRFVEEVDGVTTLDYPARHERIIPLPAAPALQRPWIPPAEMGR